MKSATIQWGGIVSLSLLCHLVVSTMAFGALGESVTTVEQDRLMLDGTSRIETNNAGLSVHVLEAQGRTVREYVSSDGVVFGIVWKQQAGPLNLEQLFGPYYEEYSRAMAAQSGRSQHGHRLETEHLVVERGGRMGATWGRVWIPSLLPPGISKDQMQ